MLKTIQHVIGISVLSLSLASPSLAQNEEMTIGAIYLDAQGFYAGVRKGIQDEGRQSGRNVQIIETNAGGDVNKEASFIDRLISAGVETIILCRQAGE